jgi:hypothetical protein
MFNILCLERANAMSFEDWEIDMLELKQNVVSIPLHMDSSAQ